MASHQLTIERAKFVASLLKPDVTVLTRDQIASFLELLETALSRCSTSNIQSCKDWLLDNVLASSNRVGVLGRYLVAIARALPGVAETPLDNKEVRRVGAQRKRLHILYLFNDIVHHAKYHDNSVALHALAGSIQPFINDLVQPGIGVTRTKTRTRLLALVQLWEEEDYFGKGFVQQLRGHAAAEAEEQDPDQSTTTGKAADTKDQPYVMPATHGDPSIPFYDLPAGNMMPHIVPNKSVPIRSEDFQALHFTSGPADEILVNAVKDFMAAASEIYKAPGLMWGHVDGFEDMDELGQFLSRDQAGELHVGRTYYGWSSDFCNKMNNRRHQTAAGKGRHRSYSSSRSRSRSPRRRAAYGDSPRSRSSSYTRSRSRNRPHGERRGGLALDGAHDRSPSRSRSHSRSRSRSYTPTFQQAAIPPQTQPPARPPPFHPPPPHEPRAPIHPNLATAYYPPPPVTSPHPVHIPPNYPFPPMIPNQGMPPMPPPRPANYSGPWPPPPPPPPLPPFAAPHSLAFNQNLSMLPFPPPPPPPPPPPQEHRPNLGGTDPNGWQR